VFKKMADPGDLVRFVASPSLYKKANAERIGGIITLGHDLETVV